MALQANRKYATKIAGSPSGRLGWSLRSRLTRGFSERTEWNPRSESREDREDLELQESAAKLNLARGHGLPGIWAEVAH